MKVLEKGLKTQIGGFKVQRVDLRHNAPCIGFLIDTPDKQKILFATDTNSIPYRFKGVNHYLVESNFSNDLMIDNLCNDIYSKSASENHMEIGDTIEFLKQSYSSDCMTIVLLHLSQGNADPTAFKKRVQEELGFSNVYVAQKGLEVELMKEEF